ncbi:unnamed protein product [Thlaspi arvense]|uniref:Glycoside hydrolase family 19 catalytic domain-containing protein n=1 Tax=Thlaspi arvense TaxID=13288 RepID=A0AAU9SBL9_THLAR|nr:unnamed protein product [Thlaspi arvense]
MGGAAPLMTTAATVARANAVVPPRPLVPAVVSATLFLGPCSTKCYCTATMVLAPQELLHYNAFIKAAESFPAFGIVGNTDHRKREIAAFWPKEQGSPPDYCVPSAQCPCAPGKKYYGRGPIQISYYNYRLVGRAIGVDLLHNLDLVATNMVISFKTALWFWMTPQSPKPSCHNVIIGQWTPSAADQGGRPVP